jgi:hypothetical protein
MGRPAGLRRGVVRTLGKRHCDRCWREFVAVAEHQRYCSPRCRRLARARDEAKYANLAHRGARKRCTESRSWAISSDLNPTDAPVARSLRLLPAIASADDRGWPRCGVWRLRFLARTRPITAGARLEAFGEVANLWRLTPVPRGRSTRGRLPFPDWAADRHRSKEGFVGWRVVVPPAGVALATSCS